MASTPNPASKLLHVRPVRPLHFPHSEPEEEHLGQHPRHEDLCMFLKLILRSIVGPEHAVSADMFVYWMATVNDDRGRRAPDAALKLGLPQAKMYEHGAWKTWELGVPELVVEILSLSDTHERWTLQEKREAYETMGVAEFVCFDLDAPEGQRIRVWDRVDGDFVERVVEGERTPCLTLCRAFGELFEWTIAPAAPWPLALRVLRGGALVALPEERAAAAQADADAARARVAELEAALAAAHRGHD